MASLGAIACDGCVVFELRETAGVAVIQFNNWCTRFIHEGSDSWDVCVVGTGATVGCSIGRGRCSGSICSVGARSWLDREVRGNCCQGIVSCCPRVECAGAFLVTFREVFLECFPGFGCTGENHADPH